MKPWSGRVAVKGATQKQIEKFKNLGVVSTSDGRQGEELDIRICKISTVMGAFHYSVVIKREFSKKAMLSIIKTVFVLILTNGYIYKSYVMTERVRSQGQASEMRFFTKNRKSYSI